MMHTIGLVLAAAFKWGGVFLPCTDQATLNEYSLERGEIVYEENADGTASAWVGGDAGRLPVTDPSALRGYAIDEATIADFAVVKTSNVTYDGVSNVWYLAGAGAATGTVSFIVKSGRDIHSLVGTVHREDTPAPSPGGWGDATLDYDGPTCVVTLAKDAACARIGWEFRSASVSASDGRINYETDLSRHVFALRDRLGLYDLCDLRQWVRDEARGRTADCWANYPATNTVRLADRRLHWDGRGRFSSGMNYGGDWTLSAGGIDAVSVHFEGTPTTSNALVITGFVVTNGQSVITYAHDIDEFDLAELTVEECRDLRTREWQAVTVGVAKDGSRVVVDNPPDLRMRFFRLHYLGQVSQVLTITLAGQINITGDVGINGTNIVAWMRGCVTGIDVNGERAPITNGVAYVHVSGGGGGTDGEAVTNIVRSLAYEQDGVNEIVSNRWTQTAERGVLPDYTAAGATVGAVGYDALLTYTTNGTLTLPVDTRVRVLAVGGGGGGAGGGSYFGRTQTGGAGGGAGGMFETNVILAAGTYAFSPGAGGAGGTVLNGGSSGGATTITFGGYTIFEVPGGGGGGNHAQPGAAGGCGGGAGGMNVNDATRAASIGDPGRFGGAPGVDSNGLVRLDWVASTVAGRQVVEIDSVTFDQTVATEITLRGMFTGAASGWQSPCGFSTEGGSLITRNPSNRFGNDKLGFNLDASKLATTPVTIVWTVGRIDGVNKQTLRVVYPDETEDTASATGTLMPGDIGRPLTLFGVGALAGGLYNFADFRLYSAVIRQDGVLKAELVPALAAGGVAGLCDETSGRFFAPTSSVPLACSPYAANLPGSGGGGMGTAGSGATTAGAGRGGDGIASDITGETVYYAGGGGGGSALSGISAGAGGLGGGGSGVTYGTAPAQKAGLDGFGGGGGGGGVGATSLADGGAGGRGIVIVRIEHTGVVTNTVPYALVTDIPTAAEWQELKARLAEIEARLNAAGGE